MQKLFVTDIDDTLSVGETVSDEVIQACSKLRSAGWDIIIATGRSYETALGHIRSVGAKYPAILCNGGEVKTPNGEEVFSTYIAPALAERVLKFLWHLPVEIQLTGKRNIYCRRADRETIRFYGERKKPISFITEPTVPEPVYRVGMWLEEKDMDYIEGILRKEFESEAEICSGGPKFMDVLPKGISKGSALSRLLSEFLPPTVSEPKLIVAAGDHQNDLELLKMADIAVIPANAHRALFEHADIVMPLATEHGVSVLIEHLLSDDFKLDPERRGKNPLVLA